MADTLSPQGQWRWNEETQDWVPNTTATQPTTASTDMSQENWKRAALMDLLTTGGKNLAKIKAAQELITPKTSEDAEKKERAKQDALRVIELLENNFIGANNGQGLAYGRVEGIKQKTAALAGKNPQLATYQGLRDSVRPMFARAAGDVGNLSEPEQRAAVKNLPTGLSTPEETILYFRAMRTKFGLPERDLLKEFSGFASKVDKQKIQILTPGYAGILSGEINEGQYENEVKRLEKGQPTTFEKIVPWAGMAIATGLQFAPHPLLKAIGWVGRGALAGGVIGATQPAEGIGERITGATTGALGGGLLGGILRPGQTLGMLRGAAAQKAAEKGIVFSGKEIAKAGAEFIKRQPLAESVGKKILPVLRKETFTPQSLLDRLSEWGKLTYTRGGDPKSTAQGQLFDILYGTARKQIAEKAPLVSAAQTALSGLHKVQKFTGRVLSPMAIGAGAAGAVGSGLIYKLLYGRE